jgi:uncharacterized short protein YbdD (DUF466 family)
MLEKLKNLWRNIRQLSGDDAYERYLAHFYEHQSEFHAGQDDAEQPLSREEFFKQWQDGKWTGIKRCC